MSLALCHTPCGARAERHGCQSSLHAEHAPWCHPRVQGAQALVAVRQPTTAALSQPQLVLQSCFTLCLHERLGSYQACTWSFAFCIAGMLCLHCPCCLAIGHLQDMDVFITTIKHKARPMAVGGTLISGKLMAGLAEAYVKAVNEGEGPCSAYYPPGLHAQRSQCMPSGRIQALLLQGNTLQACQHQSNDNTGPRALCVAAGLLGMCNAVTLFAVPHFRCGPAAGDGLAGCVQG